LRGKKGRRGKTRELGVLKRKKLVRERKKSKGLESGVGATFLWAVQGNGNEFDGNQTYNIPFIKSVGEKGKIASKMWWKEGELLDSE